MRIKAVTAVITGCASWTKGVCLPKSKQIQLAERPEGPFRWLAILFAKEGRIPSSSVPHYPLSFQQSAVQNSSLPHLARVRARGPFLPGGGEST